MEQSNSWNLKSFSPRQSGFRPRNPIQGEKSLFLGWHGTAFKACFMWYRDSVEFMYVG